MPTNVIMPQMGESIAEGTLTKWLKKPGDAVKRDEPLFEISTDKVDAEIPVPARRHPPRDPRARGPDRPDQHGRRAPRRRRERALRRRPRRRRSTPPPAAPRILRRRDRSRPPAAAPAPRPRRPLPRLPAIPGSLSSRAPPQPGESQEELLRRRSSPVVRAHRGGEGRRHLADPGHGHLGPRDEAGHRGVPGQPGGRLPARTGGRLRRPPPAPAQAAPAPSRAGSRPAPAALAARPADAPVPARAPAPSPTALAFPSGSSVTVEPMSAMRKKIAAADGRVEADLGPRHDGLRGRLLEHREAPRTA